MVWAWGETWVRRENPVLGFHVILCDKKIVVTSVPLKYCHDWKLKSEDEILLFKQKWTYHKSFPEFNLILLKKFHFHTWNWGTMVILQTVCVSIKMSCKLMLTIFRMLLWLYDLSSVTVLTIVLEDVHAWAAEAGSQNWGGWVPGILFLVFYV